MAAFDAIEAAVGQAAESHCATWATNDKFAVLERVGVSH